MTSTRGKFQTVKPDFRILDGLRGIAAVYVVFNHCRGNLLMGGAKYSEIVPAEQWSMLTKLYYAALQFTSLGTEFVIFFFVLSGFSIAHSLTRKPGLGGFYLRRLIRLYPPYIMALFYAGLVFFLVQTFAPAQLAEEDLKPVYYNAEYIFSNLVYIPKGALIGQFWSLSHEVIFYILIALLFSGYLRLYFILSIIGYLAGVIINWKGLSGETILTRFVFDYNIFFSIGIALYINYAKVASRFVFKKFIFWMVACFFFVVMVIVKFYMGDNNRLSMLISAFLSMIMVVNFLYHKVDNWLLGFFGKMSYTIYISHLASVFLFTIILDKLEFPYHSQITKPYIWLLGVLFCLLAAIPFYYAAEYPTKKLLNRLRN
ncbi:MAG: acyltransferase [Chitinophagaceae bacterium]|jgi:peptidoglycan/LPS O-acetylase OafA/YrhL|nr:MAG: acyltransferase [Chitinophagaceae bacterium]